MNNPYTTCWQPARAAAVASFLLLALWLLPAFNARAQAPAWAGAITGSLTQGRGSSVTTAVATDARGNVFITGYFDGQVAFGNILLTSRGSNDLFVAKFVPGAGSSPGAWAWALSGGGSGHDLGYGIAVSGSSVYVTGKIYNDLANANGVLFGGTGPTAGTVQVNGAGIYTSHDLVLAKYTDNGASATLGWTQVGGGFQEDIGYGIAVNGTSVYVTGRITNNTINSTGVLFGGTGTTPGTVQVNGATYGLDPDLVLAKYTDNGASATLGWTQVGGGDREDSGYGIAVSGTSVYVTGNILNNTGNSTGARFGGGGTTPGTVQVNGASPTMSKDLLLAKYTDNGAMGALSWTQVGGGISNDIGYGVAVSGSSVYVTGRVANDLANSSGVLFGGGGTTAGTVQVNGASATSSPDVLLAKYTDNGATGALGWTQVGGGTDTDVGQAVAVSGASVYVTGGITNNTRNDTGVRFGGGGTTAGTVQVIGLATNSGFDLLLAKYTDNGATGALAWPLVGGGYLTDFGNGVAVSGQNVLCVGFFYPTGVFGSYSITPSSSTITLTTVLARVLDTSLTPLAVRGAALNGGVGLALFPNPAPAGHGHGGAATLSGAAPGTAVTVFDGLGRPVTSATADASGTAALVLPAGLPAGVYVVRAGSQALRLVVE